MKVIITLKVVPSSGKSMCTLDKSGNIKCYLKNPPEHGKANKELIKLIAKAIGAPQQDVTITKGAISRYKTIRIETPLTREEIFSSLGLDVQRSVF